MVRLADQHLQRHRKAREVMGGERVTTGSEPERPPDDFWREVPCGHPRDPVAAWAGDRPVCHCGWGLDPADALPIPAPQAPGPIVACHRCGCYPAIPPKPEVVEPGHDEQTEGSAHASFVRAVEEVVVLRRQLATERERTVAAVVEALREGNDGRLFWGDAIDFIEERFKFSAPGGGNAAG